MKGKTAIVIAVAAAAALALCVCALLAGTLLLPRLFRAIPKPLYGANGELRKDVTVEQLRTIDAPHGELISVSYSHGGGMEGESSQIQIDRDTIRVSACSEHAFPLRVWVYRTPEGALDALRGYIDEYNLSVWKDLPFDEEHIALDAPSTSVRMTFDDEAQGGSRQNSCRISYDNVIPSGGLEILNGFSSLIHSFVQGDNFLETYLDTANGRIYTGRDVVNTGEEIGELVSGYWSGETYTRFASNGETVEEGGFSDAERPGLYQHGIPEILEIFYSGAQETYRLDSVEDIGIDGCDSSWNLLYRAGDGTVLLLTVAGDTLYTEKMEADGGRTLVSFSLNY